MKLCSQSEIADLVVSVCSATRGTEPEVERTTTFALEAGGVNR